MWCGRRSALCSRTKLRTGRDEDRAYDVLQEVWLQTVRTLAQILDFRAPVRIIHWGASSLSQRGMEELHHAIPSSKTLHQADP